MFHEGLCELSPWLTAYGFMAGYVLHNLVIIVRSMAEWMEVRLVGCRVILQVCSRWWRQACNPANRRHMDNIDPEPAIQQKAWDPRRPTAYKQPTEDKTSTPAHCPQASRRPRDCKPTEDVWTTMTQSLQANRRLGSTPTQSLQANRRHGVHDSPQHTIQPSEDIETPRTKSLATLAQRMARKH